jgi:hypothetical protein
MIIDAPAGLKKDLNKLIDIQQKVEILTNTINSAMNSLGIRQGRSSENAVVFAEIDSHKSKLMETCEKLYTSLNIPGDFNNNQGISIDYLQTLVLARDLKINIRERCIAGFYELEKLNQAVRGKQNALGAYTRI